MEKKAIEEKAKEKRSRYEDKARGQWNIAQDLGRTGSPALKAVKRDRKGERGEPKGSIATRPDEIDENVIRAYQTIYDGNVENASEKVKLYMAEYDSYIYKGKQARLSKIRGEDLQEVIADAAETASGMDQWAPGDLKLLSPYALEELANMLNMIEDGKAWPKQFRHARAAFLAKGEGEETDPL